MKGLLYKEFKMFECQVKTWAAVLVFLLACAVFAGETGSFIGGMCGFMVISSLSPFTEERRSGSDAYTAALPVSRREIVKARYGFLLLLDTAAAAVFGSCAMAAGWFLGKSWAETAMEVLAVLGISLILQLFLLPAVYWLGEMKARAALLIFAMGAVFLTLGLSAGGLAATEEAIKRSILSALLLSSVLLAPSYLLSASAMEKKEF